MILFCKIDKDVYLAYAYAIEHHFPGKFAVSLVLFKLLVLIWLL